MTPEEKRIGAFEDLDELLTQGVPVDAAVASAAKANEYKPEDFRSIAERQLGDLAEYAQKMQLRALNAAIAAEVEIAGSARRPNSVLRDCFELDEVAAKVERRLGRTISDDEVPKIQDAYRDFVLARARDLARRLGNNAQY